jgi:hypothetical protein
LEIKRIMKEKEEAAAAAEKVKKEAAVKATPKVE